MENMKNVITGKGDTGNEYTGIGKDGRVFPIVIYSRPIIEGGKPVGLRGIVFDITDRKSAEQKMLEEQKLAKLYLDLMGHDVNNINQAILT